jgi:EAL domain-containing protein (putative c-di-GMP-specific phosphodiesterase class I)
MDNDEDAASIVASVIDALGMRVTAEGVEDAGQLTLLQLKGCDEAQGYLFSRSVQASDVRAIFENSFCRRFMSG